VRRLFSSLFLALMALLLVLPSVAVAEEPMKNVYVLRIDNFQEIDASLAQFSDRIFSRAEADPNAAAIAVILDTPGGYVDAANRIKERLLTSKLRSVAFVDGGAISAGALIATASEKLFMSPGSIIGAAEPRIAGTNETADYKAKSVVMGYFKSAAQARGRDEAIALAMVDKDSPIPGQQGMLLTLTQEEALQKGYADGSASSLEEALAQAGIAGYQLVETPWTFSERAGRFLTLPFVALALLVIGVIAIGMEFMKPGVTVPGLIGVVSLGLFFVGNTLVGTAGWLEISLAIIGIVLLVIEAFVPGFGVFGAGGVLSMGASIFFAVPSQELAWRYLMWTAVAFLFVIIGVMRTVSKRGLGRALTLSDTAKGWVAPRTDLSALIGQQGKSLTVLRPAGTAQVGDLKLDVVTEGEYLQAGILVKIIRVDGTRVVVRAVGD